MVLRLNAADAAVQADQHNTIFSSPLKFSYEGNFDYQPIPLKQRTLGMWKVLPLAVMTIAQFAKTILCAPMAFSSAKTEIMMGEMYKVAWLAHRTFAHLIAPFGRDEKAQRLDYTARYSANCETLRREKYEQERVTVKEYLDAPEELQQNWNARFTLTDSFRAAITETEKGFLDGITLDWNPLEAIATIARREASAATKMLAANTSRRATSGCIPASPQRSTIVRDTAALFNSFTGGSTPATPAASSTPTRERSADTSAAPQTPLSAYFVRNPDSDPPSAKKPPTFLQRIFKRDTVEK